MNEELLNENSCTLSTESDSNTDATDSDEDQNDEVRLFQFSKFQGT